MNKSCLELKNILKYLCLQNSLISILFYFNVITHFSLYKDLIQSSLMSIQPPAFLIYTKITPTKSVIASKVYRSDWIYGFQKGLQKADYIAKEIYR